MSQPAFNLKEFIARLMTADGRKDWTSDITEKEAMEICGLAKQVFVKEETLASMKGPCRVLGDIHGQFQDLIDHLHAQPESTDKKPYETEKWVFLGDYVDRGPRSLEVICLLFALKVQSPDRFVLLRGNHECKAINSQYGLKMECEKAFGNHKVFEKLNEVFSWMPLACLVDNNVLCMHGGISEHLKSLEDIKNIARPLVEVGTVPLAVDLLWSEPMSVEEEKKAGDEEPVFKKNPKRGNACVFNETAVVMLCLELDLRLIVRGHQMVSNGFRWHAGTLMITLFSAPQYMRVNNNRGAQLMLLENDETILYQSPVKEKIVDKEQGDDVTQFLEGK